MKGIFQHIRGFVDSTECWHKIVECQQSKTESVMEYTQRYAQTFMLYGGCEMSSKSDVLGSHVPVSQWTDLRKVLPILKPTWRALHLSGLADTLSAYERDSDVKAYMSAMMICSTRCVPLLS